MNSQSLPTPPRTPDGMDMVFNFWPEERWDEPLQDEWIPVPRSILPEILEIAREERRRLFQ